MRMNKLSLTLAILAGLSMSSVAFGQSTNDYVKVNPKIIDSCGGATNDPTLSPGSIAIGDCAKTDSINQVAIGKDAQAKGNGSLALGSGSLAQGGSSTAIGTDAKTGIHGLDIAIGQQAEANGGASIAIGTTAKVYSTSSDPNYVSTSIAIGDSSTAQGQSSIALGASATAGAGKNSYYSIAIGANATSQNDFSIALGANSKTTRTSTVSVGDVSQGFYRIIESVGNGRLDHDAVNVGQMKPFASAFGSGSNFANGIFMNPTYILTATGSAGTYNNVGDALTALDDGLNAVNDRIDNLDVSGVPGPQGPVGPQGPKGDKGDQGPQGIPGKDGQDGKDAVGGSGVDKLAVHYDDSTKQSITLGKKNSVACSGKSDCPITQTRIHNVANAKQAHDAVNLGQTEALVNDGVVRSNHYTDTRINQVKSWANNYINMKAKETLIKANHYTDMKFRGLDVRLNRMMALGSAETSMSANFRGRNSMAVGVGFAGGHNAISVGYRHVFDDGHVSASLHGAIAGPNRTIGVGAGYSW